MKVGILTFIHSNNFGANLQCYALQETVKNLVDNVEVIDIYRPCDQGYIPCKDDETRFAGLYVYKSLKDYHSKLNKITLKLLNRLNKNKEQMTKITGFHLFQKKYINFSKQEYRNFTTLYTNFPSKEYSHLIVGSDQVWNYATDFSKEPFFLTFCTDVKKISYAASVGHSEIPDVVGIKYSNWLADFSSISVREDTAVIAISKLTDKDVIQTLDPTFLLTKQEWLDHFFIKEPICKDIILVYMLSISTETLMLAQNIAENLNCSIKVITSKPYYKTLKNCEFLRSENPRSFVELYSRAKFVVTNSFHGTAFAINFNVPFVTLDKNGARLNSRKLSLLKLLHLSDRYLLEGQQKNLKKILSCDFTESNEILNAERQKSLYFLSQALR